MENETIETLVNRRSCKSYSSRQISKEDLDAVLKAGLYAANGRGLQSPVFLAVQNAELRNRLSRLNAAVLGISSDPFYGAPSVIAVLADTEAHTWIEDGSLALGNMMNAAYSLKIDSCWIHRAKEVFDSPEGKQILKENGMKENLRGVGFCILGYADGELKPAAPRKENRIFYSL